MQNNFRFNIKYIILIIIALTVGVAIWLLSRYSYLEVTTVNSQKNATIELATAGSDPLIDTFQQNSYKKLVKKGQYEITVKSDSKNSFSVVSTGGFLTTTSVKVTLRAEKNREFIGSNPRPCMNVTPVGLLSYGCGDKIQTTNLHVPATNSTPTYTKLLQTTLDGYIEGVAKFQNQEYIFVKSAYEAEDQAPHAAYILKADATLGTVYALDDLDEDALYSYHSYKNGLLAVTSNNREAFYYTSLTEPPKKIDISHPDTNNKNYPYDIDVFGDTIVVGFSDSEVADDEAEDAKTSPNIKGSVVVLTNGKSEIFTFNKLFNDIQICERGRLCVLVDNILSVYDISSDKQKMLYSISEVSSIKRTPLGLVVVRNNEVINMDVSLKSGSMDFVSKYYSSCGVQPATEGYILCTTNSRNENNALLLTNGEPNSVDSYVAKLLEVPEIKTITPYKNYIFISPNLGKLQYDAVSKTYDYDRQIKSRATSVIDETIKNLNADPRYIFINPLR